MQMISSCFNRITQHSAHSPEWWLDTSLSSARGISKSSCKERTKQTMCIRLHTAHVGPMVAEMVRPDVTGQGWGGYDVEKLRIAGLARAIQTRLPYLHHCNPVYCLKDRPSCRFFFPWPYQPHQCFDENTQRVALQRRLPEDDQFVVSVSTLGSLDETVHSQICV